MNKVQPKTLSGFMELLPNEQILFNQMQDKIRSTYEKFGFLPIDTPVIESSDVLLAKAGGETEKQLYSFSKGDSNLTLRFDLTVPLAKYVAEYYNQITFPFRRYQIGKVYRGERAQRGRFREFYQCDIDVIGDGELNIINDAEIPAIMYETFKSLGLDDLSIHINNRKRLNGLFEDANVQEKSADILRTIDKIEKIGKEIYYNRKYIQELLGVISSRQVISREGFLRLPSFPFYRGTFSLDVEKKVLSLFEDILSSGSSETIRTNLPANCRLLVQIFSHLYPKYEKLPPVIQILPLHQNPSSSPDYNMNLETFLCTLLPILSGFAGYQPYYYYTDRKSVV